jgi:hypothetical protein
VPLRAPACHCGTTRAQAEELAASAAVAAAPPPPAAPRRGGSLRDDLARTMSRDVKIMVGVGAFVVVVGLGWMAFGPRPAPTAPVLGFVDQGPPPAPKKAPTQPAFKLPWWK